ncbi:MAG: hypothetical protein QM775_12365 [Pirellulales bacterium]
MAAKEKTAKRDWSGAGDRATARRSSVRRGPELSTADSLYLLLQRSATARFIGVTILSVPAVFVLALFWWNVRAEQSPAVATTPVPAALPIAASAPSEVSEATQFLSSSAGKTASSSAATNSSNSIRRSWST